MAHLLATARELAARQHGLVRVHQLAEIGLDKTRRRRMVEAGEWQCLTPAVFRVQGSSDTPDQRWLAAVLDAGVGAVLSHASSMDRWGLPGFRQHRPEVIGDRPRARYVSPIAIVHRPLLLLPHHVLVTRGVPVTTPTRTIFDLAGRLHPGRLARLVDNVWNRRLTSGRLLHRTLDELAGRGRPGIAAMREVLATRGDDYVPPESGLEARFMALAIKAGLPEIRRQVDIGNDERWLGRVDFLEDRAMVVVEIQSHAFHESELDRAADEARHSAFRAAGFEVVEFTEYQVWHEGQAVIDALRTARWHLAG
jgi:very-short-patch-repair endonuclease